MKTSLVSSLIFITSSFMSLASPSDTLYQIAALKATVSGLQSQITAQNAQISALQQHLSTIACNPVLQLGPYVYLDMAEENGVKPPNIVFHSANVHLTNGTGQTDNSNFLGNLIIGYDEASPGVLFPGARNGSHNLIIGRNNLFRTFGGIVQGEGNSINGFESAVIGGSGNIAFGNFSSVFGGASNQALNSIGTVVGGSLNTANGILETLVGGFQNSLSLNYGSTLGSSAGAPQ